MNALVSELQQQLRARSVRKLVVIADATVSALYPHYWDELSHEFPTIFMDVPAGDASKSIAQAEQLWLQLLEACCDRDVFILNFGGGMVCDLGGFVAATYKRGVRFANCPTTLLAMIDAAIGGKNGVNVRHVKNCVGTFCQPEFELPCDLSFLQTLSEKELLSGFGELIKCAIIGAPALFCELEALEHLTPGNIQPGWIDKCISVKHEFVKRDPYDLHERHVLNLGHTYGHAIESLFAEEGRPVAHGEAVALGLFYESRLMAQIGQCRQEDADRVERLVRRHYRVPAFTEDEVRRLVDFMQQDKKNQQGHVVFVQLRGIGDVSPDCRVALDLCAKVIR
ncbi:MAG: 3-dehydroquinate synthase [Bacteroidales bacterium]|nr:3-dehydroquinate synthase [Bacteroidales bacterium]